MNYVKSPLELGLTTDSQGIYIESNKPRIEAMMSTGFLEFGIGDTRVDAEFSTIESRMRGHESSKNLGWQHYLLDSIPNPGYRDYALHKEVRQTFAAQLQDPKTGKRNEVFCVAVEQMLIEQFVKSKDFEPIREWLNEKVRNCAAKLNPNHEKQAVNLRDVQILVIKKVISALRQNGVVTNFVCELAARIGKTILFLELAKTMQEEFGHESMFIMAYGVGLSVKTSYKDEIEKYIDFAYLQFIDAAEADAIGYGRPSGPNAPSSIMNQIKASSTTSNPPMIAAKPKPGFDIEKSVQANVDSTKLKQMLASLKTKTE
jgi:hypothetical protein